MSKTASKVVAYVLRKVGLTAAVGIPASEVLKRFPIWRPGEAEPIDGRSLGIGGVILVIIGLFALRERIWPAIKARLHLGALGSTIFWGGGFGLLLALEWYLVPKLPDLRSIWLAGFVGAITGLTCDVAAGIIDKK
ncbi:MAG: hypothetical protein IIV80_01760 [Clostridia bacterium]|nr:hypothetical protein [Clostridia bacterium]